MVSVNRVFYLLAREDQAYCTTTPAAAAAATAAAATAAASSTTSPNTPCSSCWCLWGTPGRGWIPDETERARKAGIGGGGANPFYRAHPTEGVERGGSVSNRLGWGWIPYARGWHKTAAPRRR